MGEFRHPESRKSENEGRLEAENGDIVTMHSLMCDGDSRFLEFAGGAFPHLLKYHHNPHEIIRLYPRSVEYGDTLQVFEKPAHPDTEAYITGRFS